MLKTILGMDREEAINYLNTFDSLDLKSLISFYCDFLIEQPVMSSEHHEVSTFIGILIEADIKNNK